MPVLTSLHPGESSFLALCVPVGRMRGTESRCGVCQGSVDGGYPCTFAVSSFLTPP